MHARTEARYATRRKAAWALENTTHKQKQLAELLGVSQSAVSRYISGEIESVVGACYEVVRKCIADRRAEAGHIIAGMMDVAQDEAAEKDVGQLFACLDLALERETEAQQAEDRAQHRVIRSLARLSSKDASPADWYELSEAGTAHDEAILHENAAHCVVLYYLRALMKNAPAR